MKILSKIYRVLTNTHSDDKQVYNILGVSPQAQKLADGLRSGISDDKNAANLLGFESPQDERYHSEKYRFWQFVVDLACVSPISRKFAPIQRARLECQKLQLLISILGWLGMNDAHITAAQRLRRKSKRFGFTDSWIQALYVLRNEATNKGDTAGFKKHDTELMDLIECQKAEVLAVGVFQRMQTEFARSAAHNPNLKPQAESVVSTLKGYVDEFNSPALWDQYFSGLIFEAQISGDLSRVKDACRLGIAWYQKRPHLAYSVRLAKFHLLMASASYFLRHTEAGIREVAGAITNYNEHSRNWRTAQEYHFLLLMQAGAFEKAAAVCSKVITGLDATHPAHLEKWDLFAASLVVAMPETVDKLPVRVRGITADTFGKRFKIFSKDKRGYNISIEILNYVLLLRDFAVTGSAERHDQILSAATALRRRITDDLRKVKPFHYRSGTTIKALADLAKLDFNFTKCVKKIDGYITRISTVPAEYGGKLDTVEPLPFEDVCRIALDAVKEIDAKGYVSGRDYENRPIEVFDYEKFINDSVKAA